MNYLKQTSGSKKMILIKKKKKPSVIHLCWETDKKNAVQHCTVTTGIRDEDEVQITTIISRCLTSAAAGSTDLSRSDTAPASILAAPMSLCPLPTSSSINAASNLTPFDISVRLEEMVVMAQPTAV